MVEPPDNEDLTTGQEAEPVWPEPAPEPPPAAASSLARDSPVSPVVEPEETPPAAPNPDQPPLPAAQATRPPVRRRATATRRTSASRTARTTTPAGKRTPSAWRWPRCSPEWRRERSFNVGAEGQA